MTLAEIEQTRRSLAMAPLSKESVARVLDELRRHVEERERIAAILHDLPPTVGALREALNELHRLVANTGRLELE
jgi:hypothetical protein